jgi:hypothetical protein
MKTGFWKFICGSPPVDARDTGPQARRQFF